MIDSTQTISLPTSSSMRSIVINDNNDYCLLGSMSLANLNNINQAQKEAKEFVRASVNVSHDAIS